MHPPIDRADTDATIDDDAAERTAPEARHRPIVPAGLRRFVPIVIIAAGLVGGYMAGLHDYLSLDQLAAHRDTLKQYVADHSIGAALAFVFAYALAVAFSFPAASVLTVLGGFLFGWLIGGLLTAIAATSGATAIFLAARSAFGDVLKKRAGPWAALLAGGFEENAFGYLLVLRLAPVFPFFVMNIAPALFDVKLRTYVPATMIGILPGTFAYAYLGEGLDSVIVSAAEAGRTVSVSDLVTTKITIAFAVLALVAAVPTVVRKLRAARRKDSR